MKIHEVLDTIRKGSRYLGTFRFPELIAYAASRGINGIAEAGDGGRELYLAFLNGEPEGAIYLDEKGGLFGDKAALMIAGSEQFALREAPADVVDVLIMSSRIFDKNRITKCVPSAIPEIGRGSGGIGVLKVVVTRGGAPANGIRVSIRKDGKIVGSDITTENGDVGFRVAYSNYECILQDRTQAVTRYRITFDGAHPSVRISL